METLDVGKRIKSIRKKKGLTLQEISEKSGISATAISAIERNISSPTVSTLAGIGRALGESLSSLLGEIGIEYILTRAGERKRIATGVRNVEFQSLASGLPSQRFHPMLSDLPAGSANGDDYVNHRSEDFFFVMQGKLDVEVNGNVISLAAGDSLYLPAGSPYRWKNASDGETRILFVTTD